MTICVARPGRLTGRGDPAVKRGPIVLVAHGSQDPRSAATMRRLAACVAARWPAPVTVAFLDFNLPSVPSALRALSSAASSQVAWPAASPATTPATPPATPPIIWPDARPVVVPALLTSAYHGRIDLPEVLRATGVPTRVTPVIGPSRPEDAPDRRLLAALRRRVSELDTPFDGLVLLAAGTSDERARSTVDGVAAAISVELNVACEVGYASASSRTGADAVAALRAAGSRRIVAASYFLAPGRLHDAAADSARSAGASDVAAPLGAAQELVDLVLARATRPCATPERRS